ncbi:MAG: hypothetical protein E7455_02230 [Ruminococcaceae bacterium]|nr:hypothetical protein [Oscillospiraceae bacterium]
MKKRLFFRKAKCGEPKTEKCGFVKGNFWGRKIGIVKNAEGEKVGKKSKKVENNYVNEGVFSSHFFCKNRPVEKVVENVEKSILSTKKPENHPLGRGTKTPFFEKNAVLKVAVITCYGNKNCKEVPVLFW